MWITSLMFEGIGYGFVQVLSVPWHEVRQLRPLRVVPNMFHGVEVGSITGQPFDLQPSCSLFCQFAHGTPMYAPAVQDHDDLSSQLPVQMPQEVHDVIGRDIAVEKPKVEAQSQCPRRHRDGTQCAPAVMPVPGVEDRRMATRGPGPTSQRLQHEARFVEKDQASLSREPLFLSAANPRGANGRSPLRRVRAPAVRASANSSPACALAFPRNRRDRLRRTDVRSPRPPVDTSTDRSSSRPSYAPRSSVFSNRSFCRTVKRGGRPGCGLALKACSPCLSRASFQRFTEETELFTIDATSVNVFFCRNNCNARMRRASNCSAVPMGLIPKV